MFHAKWVKKLVFEIKKKKQGRKEYPLPPSRRNIFQLKIKFPARRNKYSGKGKARDRWPCNISDKKFQSSKRSTVSIETALMNPGVSLHLAAITYYRIMNRSALLCVTLTFNYTKIRFPLQPFRGEREMEINRDQIRGWTDSNIERCSRDEVFPPRGLHARSGQIFH